MTLTLTITNRDRLENGSPRELVLHQRGAIIGRAQTCEWPLPDDARVLSSRHCEIQFRDGSYMLIDVSTNGTFLGNEPDRMSGPHKIRHGERFRLGPFEVEARLSGEARAQFDAENAASAQAANGPAWSDWDDFPGGSQPPAAAAHDPFAPSAAASWDMPGALREDVSAWADRAGGGAGGPSADQIFNSLTDNHKVDWTSAAWDVAPGFDPFAVPGDSASAAMPSTSDPFTAAGAAPAPTGNPFGAPSAPAPDPFGGPINPREQAPAERDPFAPLPSALPASPAPSPAPPPMPTPAPAPSLATRALAQPLPSAANEAWPAQAGAAAPPAPPSVAHPGAAPPQQPAHALPEAAYRELIAALGISSTSLTESPEVAAARAGRMLRRLLAGLMILLEARARAKDEMGASATQLRFEGNNPLKFARNVEQALQMMMNPAMQGYMEADSAIEDSYRDLQAHQIATLRAMQGALRATLQRFSPTAIKARAGEAGVLEKIVPGQREAALWRAYEKQFSGVAEGSAEAFLDIFSKEFRQAYEDAARGN
ncbi:FHA domain protein [Tsuneonella dongtanensis]|uniref:FHA domain protein n=1 Tax=Tsuneonella dongtanensis TaxID=692370 RepID=A0A1B2AB80_9SPHN|nr:type VI secretion system-associated FHA domain protein TagH [Tsuneonella dongtanensis]ANY19392.1 FHA domain protein [Tsuneonella dongtanensis]